MCEKLDNKRKGFNGKETWFGLRVLGGVSTGAGLVLAGDKKTDI